MCPFRLMRYNNYLFSILSQHQLSSLIIALRFGWQEYFRSKMLMVWQKFLSITMCHKMAVLLVLRHSPSDVSQGKLFVKTIDFTEIVLYYWLRRIRKLGYRNVAELGIPDLFINKWFNYKFLLLNIIYAWLK